jgi:cytochrome c biogenesis protein CcmG/thiol:disulfide interchange protein DsbE
MTKKQSRRKDQKPFPVLPMLVGLALVGFGALAMYSPASNTNAVSSSSVVPMEVNFAAPELSLQNINGKTESLAAYRTDVVLVNNWATWCPPCKAEMPTLSDYYNEHHADGFTIVAVEAGDPLQPVAQFAESYQLQFPVWLDPNGDSINAFGNGNLPNSYVIDRTGMVRYAWTGEISKDMLEKYVTPLIEEK